MRIGSDAGVSVQIYRKSEIQQMGMGGLLAVNKGSTEQPTFTVMEYKPSKAVNKKPIVLVGKGVVYDSGGLSLKPSEYMDDMKCDMAGAAVVMNTISIASKIELPLHIIALIPSTDNRLSAESYAPGDIITMHNGKTVEVRYRCRRAFNSCGCIELLKTVVTRIDIEYCNPHRGSRTSDRLACCSSYGKCI